MTNKYNVLKQQLPRAFITIRSGGPMSNLFRITASSSKDEILSISNQGTDCFLDLLILAGTTLAQSKSQKEILAFLKGQREINEIAPGTAGFDLVELPWDVNHLEEDTGFFLKVVREAMDEKRFAELPYTAEKEIVIPQLKRFAEMIQKFLQQAESGSALIKEKILRKKINEYINDQYGIEEEQLPFNHEDYRVYRHQATGKWFAVLLVKSRKEFGLRGKGNTALISLKPKDPLLAETLMDQPGFLRGYPNRKWNWISILLDGSVPFEEIKVWIDESYNATRSKAANKKVPLRPR